jgi:Tol biopolymer transport system component
MTPDRSIKDRLARAADPLPIDVDERLQLLHGDRRSRIVRQRMGVFAVVAGIALLLVLVVWRLLPLGSVSVPAAPTEPSGTLAVMTGSVSQPGDPFNFFDLDSFRLGDGGALGPLEDTDERASFPAWSPDGGKLAYLTGQPPRRVVVVANADGSHPTELAAVLTGDGFAWSPDGTRIAYRARTSRGADGTAVDVLVVSDLTGDSQGTYVSLDGAWQAFDWSPDGRTFVFTGDPNVPTSQDLTSPPSQLWVQNLDGSGLRRLVDGMAVATPHWSPDGSRIVFACHDANEADDRFDICLIDADGSGFVRLTGGNALNAAPVWSPDGQWIAFASDRATRPTGEDVTTDARVAMTVFLMRPDGSDVRQLLPADDGRVLAPTGWRL